MLVSSCQETVSYTLKDLISAFIEFSLCFFSFEGDLLHCFKSFFPSGVPSALNGVSTGDSTAGKEEGRCETVI